MQISILKELIWLIKKKIVVIKSLIYNLLGYDVYHFLHIGKTGGTATKHALRHYKQQGKKVIFLHEHNINLADIPRGDKVFFFVRDPVRRFVSGFNSRKRMGRPRYYVPWTSKEKHAFDKFPEAQGLAVALESTEAKRAMWSIRHVNTKLSDWLISEKYVNERRQDIVFVGRLENIEEDFEDLKQLLDLPKNLKLPKTDRLKHSSGIKHKKLSKQAIKNLKDWYKNDYKLLSFLQKENLLNN